MNTITAKDVQELLKTTIPSGSIINELAKFLEVIGVEVKLNTSAYVLGEAEQALVFSKEELIKTLNSITPKEAFRWIAIIGGIRKVMDMLKHLAKTYSVKIPDKAVSILKQASKDYAKVPVPNV